MDRVSFNVNVPASKKNRRVIAYRFGKPKSFPSQAAIASEREIREAWLDALGHAGIVWPSEDVRVQVNFYVGDDTCHISVYHHGERPAGKTGRRRDLHGMIETICDALEGLAFKNDNQVAAVSMLRMPGNNPYL